LLPALERRRIAPIPRLRISPIFKGDYSRDLRLAKWVSMIDLRAKILNGFAAVNLVLFSVTNFRIMRQRSDLMKRESSMVARVRAPCR